MGFEPKVVELTLTVDYVAYMGSAGRAPTSRYTLAFALQLRKITETLSQGSRNNGSDHAFPLLGERVEAGSAQMSAELLDCITVLPNL